MTLKVSPGTVWFSLARVVALAYHGSFWITIAGVFMKKYLGLVVGIMVVGVALMISGCDDDSSSASADVAGTWLLTFEYDSTTIVVIEQINEDISGTMTMGEISLPLSVQSNVKGDMLTLVMDERIEMDGEMWGEYARWVATVDGDTLIDGKFYDTSDPVGDSFTGVRL